MEERHRRIVVERAGRKAGVELVEHVARRRMQVGERLRAEIDPDQLRIGGVSSNQSAARSDQAMTS
jgi:hypothetical protein